MVPDTCSRAAWLGSEFLGAASDEAATVPIYTAPEERGGAALSCV